MWPTEGLEGRPSDGHGPRRHAHAQGPQVHGELVGIPRGEDQYGLPDPDDPRAVHKSFLADQASLAIRAHPAEDDLAHARRGGSRGALHVVGEKDPLSLVSFQDQGTTPILWTQSYNSFSLTPANLLTFSVNMLTTRACDPSEREVGSRKYHRAS